MSLSLSLYRYGSVDSSNRSRPSSKHVPRWLWASGDSLNRRASKQRSLSSVQAASTRLVSRSRRPWS